MLTDRCPDPRERRILGYAFFHKKDAETALELLAHLDREGAHRLYDCAVRACSRRTRVGVATRHGKWRMDIAELPARCAILVAKAMLDRAKFDTEQLEAALRRISGGLADPERPVLLGR